MGTELPTIYLEIRQCVSLSNHLPIRDLRKDKKGAGLLSRLSSSLQTAALFTRLLIVRVLLELSEKTALLQLHVEALERAVDRFVGLYCNVNQVSVSANLAIMARITLNLQP